YADIQDRSYRGWPCDGQWPTPEISSGATRAARETAQPVFLQRPCAGRITPLPQPQNEIEPLTSAPGRFAMPDPVASLTDAILAPAKSAGAEEADALAVRGTSLSIDVRNRALEQAERSEGVTIGLRVMVGQ